MAGLGDIRAVGSGNIGATNVLRTGRRGLAAGTLLLDAAKGALAVLIAGWLGRAVWMPLAAIARVVGHCFPVWLRFRGGKGVATGLGVLLALDWHVGVLACAIWLAVFAAHADQLGRRAGGVCGGPDCRALLLAAVLVGGPARDRGARLGAPPRQHRAGCSPGRNRVSAARREPGAGADDRHRIANFAWRAPKAWGRSPSAA